MGGWGTQTFVFVKCQAQAGPGSQGPQCYGWLEQGGAPQKPARAGSAVTFGILGTEWALKGLGGLWLPFMLL